MKSFSSDDMEEKTLHHIGQTDFPISFKAPKVVFPVDKNVITFSQH